MTKVTVYHGCDELMREQFVGMFGDDLDADFLYQLKRKSLISATFLAAGMGSAYMRDS